MRLAGVVRQIALELASIAALCTFSSAEVPGHLARVKDVATIEGIRDNQLVGYGLVVGLRGSGDSIPQTVFPAQTPDLGAGKDGYHSSADRFKQRQQYAGQEHGGCVCRGDSAAASRRPGYRIDIVPCHLAE